MHFFFKQMDSKLMEEILSEFEKSNNNTSDLFRIQDDLSNCESNLVALQIRYVHKNKENEDLKHQLELKNKLISERKTQFECNLQRLQTLEFHHNELMQKHKLCLDCMTKLKHDFEHKCKDYEQINARNKVVETDKAQITSFFRNEIEDLNLKMSDLSDENEKHIGTIRELRNSHYDNELDKNKQSDIRLALERNNKLLNEELGWFKDEYNQNIEKKSIKLSSYEDNIKKLELDLAKMTSKFDEANLELNDVKKKHSEQNRIANLLQNSSYNKEIQYNEVKLKLEKSLNENGNLERQITLLRSELGQQLDDFNYKFGNTSRLNDQERDQFKKQQTMFEGIVQKLTLLYNGQQKKFESIVLLSKNQETLIKTLRAQAAQFKGKLQRVKANYFQAKSESRECTNEMKSLQDKYAELEQRYEGKYEHFTNIEREIFLSRNSLESAMNDMANLQNIIRMKEDELLSKSQSIDNLQTIITQQSNELSKRKLEICERINQIDVFDTQLKTEKASLEVKMDNLEANLKTKSKQLHQRIEQIKEMSEIVEGLKDEKEQVNYKLQQYENIIKCQKLDIESKASILKQLELRHQDTTNELNSLKLTTNPRETLPTKSKKEDKVIQCSAEVTTDHSQTDQNETSNDASILLLSSSASQTIELSSVDDKEKSIIDDLKLNLRIKDDLIETVNDSLVLKEAEIARLRTKIGIYERKQQLIEINEDSEKKF